MISSRRRAHRLIFIGLAFVLPLLLAAAFILRPDVPAPGADFEILRREASFASPSSETLAVEQDTYAFEAFVRTNGGGRAVLELRPVIPILEPDLLVYWALGDEEPNTLPSDAILLGSLSGAAARSMSLPDRAARGEGQALIYSLGYQKVVTQIALERVLGAEAR